jgi:hypothetical protein
MATGNVKVGGTGLAIKFNLADLERTSETFKQARRDIGRDLRTQVVETADNVVLPTAKTRATNLKVKGRGVAASLVVRKGPGNAAYLTTSMRGINGRVIGLQEFGGTVRTRILPKKPGGAIRTPWGPRASISGPRHYKGRHFLTGAVKTKYPEFERRLLKDLMQAFSPLDHTP